MSDEITQGLHLGDCMDLLPRVPSGIVRLVIADLPYGVTQNKWDSIIPMDRLWAEYDRVCLPNAAIVLTASQPFTSYLVMSRPDLFRHEWIWIKNRGSNFANTVREPFKEHESILVFSKGKWVYNPIMQERTGGGADRAKYAFVQGSGSTNYRQFETRVVEKLPDMRVPSSWQKINTETGLHPTQKPVALFEYLIRTYSDEGDLVLDNCVGSGTTAVASIRTKRRWIAMERDPDYHTKAQARITKEISDMDPFNFVDQTD